MTVKLYEGFKKVLGFFQKPGKRRVWFDFWKKFDESCWGSYWWTCRPSYCRNYHTNRRVHLGNIKGYEKARIKKIQEKWDKDLEEFEKQSEIELTRLKGGFNVEIEMRKEKLSELNEEYTKK